MDRKEIKETSRLQLKENWGNLLLALLLWGLLSGVAGLLSVGVGSVIVAGPLMLGVYYIYNDIRLGGDGDWKDIIKGFKVNFGDAVLVNILKCLCFGIPLGFVLFTMIFSAVKAVSSVFTMGSGMSGGGLGGGMAGFAIGSILTLIIVIALLVAGLCLLYMYAEAEYILMSEPEISALGAMKKSRLMMKGNKKAMLIFDLSFIGWFFLSAVTFGLLLIWVGPYYMSARIRFLDAVYQDKKDISMDIDEDIEKLKNMKNRVSNSKKTEIAEDDNTEKAEAVSPKKEKNTDKAKSRKKENVCMYCGAKLPEGAKFCGKCGKEQQ